MSPARITALPDNRMIQPAALELWERFRTRFEGRVSEGNMEAGEPLWTTASARGPNPGVVVRSTTSAADYVELVFDPAQASLKCTFGPAIGRGDCEFPLHGECDLTTDEAVFCVLDALIFPDQV